MSQRILAVTIRPIRLAGCCRKTVLFLPQPPIRRDEASALRKRDIRHECWKANCLPDRTNRRRRCLRRRSGRQHMVVEQSSRITGGIGENAPAVRQRICDGLGFVRVKLDVTKNDSNASVISGRGSAVSVRVIQTNEELMIAQHTSEVCGQMQQATQKIQM